MTTTTSKKEMYQALRPTDIALYLRAKHWTQDAQHKTLWFLGEEEVLLPTNREAGDYALRIGDLLEALAMVEQRNPSQVYEDLQTIGFDTLRIRIADTEMSDGTLPIEQHTQIAQKTRELVLSAACAAIEKRAFWPTRKPTKATEHIRRVRIGQSERGSYIVTVLCRVTPLLHTPTNPSSADSEETFERQVTLMLAHSLRALEHASREAALQQELAAFSQAIPAGVSANLCDAVAGFWGDEHAQRKVDFLFSWSPNRPVIAEPISKVSFSSDRVPFLRAASIQLRDTGHPSDIEITGPVVKFERSEGAEKGKATLYCHVEERPLRVVFELSEPDYNMVTNAHRDGCLVTVSGSLQKEGRSFSLKNPHHLIIESNES